MPDRKAEKAIRVSFNTQLFDPSDLVVYEKNNKDHPEEQIVQLMKSIGKYGVVAPLIIDSNKVIIAWHGTREACIRLGMKEVPCDVRDDLTPKEARELRIYHNRISELGKRNKDNLLFELTEIMSEDLMPLFPDIDIMWETEEPKKKNKKYKIYFPDAETLEKAKNILTENNITYTI